jgi:OOP family OmpA-OmpF porin
MQDCLTSCSCSHIHNQRWSLAEPGYSEEAKMADKKLAYKGVLSALVVGMGLGLATTVHAGYWTDSSGNPVFTGYGECWKAVGGTTKKFAACGDVIEEPKAEPAPAPAPPPPPPGPTDSDGDGVYDHLDKCPGTRPGAKVDSSGCEIVANLQMNMVNDHFAFDSAKLTPKMEAALADLANKLQATPASESVNLVGHTCSIGPDAYNVRLSIRRAEAVADFLMSQGVSREVIAIEGKGESAPAHDNATRAGRSANRRVEITTR